MSEPTDQDIAAEPHEGLDSFANPDAKAAEDRIQPLSRASGEGPPPTDAPPADTAPTVEGTGAGDPLAGVRIDDEDAAHAVDPEDGSGRA
ncbi:hypothetical protein SAMN05443575_4014 [Jatrophihabitans endophyticus]|uniref:Uncharacterized protein n=1 Tax=Jatrophihabitans endophyticus TaxID=1206085 RepID=A0A1M5TRC7_9ACTN|nr:hypothetical protein [Jatrophihabitans endophyticus]SHH53241.1 hypothetical protein SAMN05443575_4014 [Jatrophihabitans endophyticus]